MQINFITTKTPQTFTGPPELLGALDKLAQPGKLERREKLKKRAKQKFFTNHVAGALAELKNTPLHWSYVNTLSCCVVLKQDGKEITSKYCGNRWCTICNNVRTGKLINGYLPVIKEMKVKNFVTLTIKNVPGPDLSGAIDKMLSNFSKIRDVFRKRGLKINGLRKLECTFNETTREFHPHFHLILNHDQQTCEEFIAEWIKRNPTAKESAQDQRPANDHTAAEMFKYFTKIATYNKKDNIRKIHISALDVIFCAMRGRRVFQPFGIKKEVSEDIEEIDAMQYDINEAQINWIYNTVFNDWIDSETGEVLTNFKPSQTLLDLVENIDTSYYNIDVSQTIESFEVT